MLTREPGGTKAAEAIRELVLDPRFKGLDARAEALLFAAARAEHVDKLILPALAHGKVVICDRYIDSSVAYQGLARDLGAQCIRDLSAWATDDLIPDLTIVLDIDPAIGLQRAQQVSEAPDRMESEALAFHQMVRAAFVAAAAENPQRYAVIDAAQPMNAVTEAIIAKIEIATF